MEEKLKEQAERDKTEKEKAEKENGKGKKPVRFKTTKLFEQRVYYQG